MQGRSLMYEAYLFINTVYFDKFAISAFTWRTDIKQEG